MLGRSTYIQDCHIIFLDEATTGDGQLSGAKILEILKASGCKMSELAGVMDKFPQVMINVKVSHEGKLKFYLDSEVKAAVEWGKTTLGRDGRVVVRVSGTEPLIRIMAEGEDPEAIRAAAEDTAARITKQLESYR